MAVQANPVQQQPMQEPQVAAVQEPAIPPQTFFTQVTDTANWAWGCSAQKVTDLKDGILELIQKVIISVVNFIEMVVGWVGYGNPAPAQVLQAVEPPQQQEQVLEQAAPQEEAQQQPVEQQQVPEERPLERARQQLEPLVVPQPQQEIQQVELQQNGDQQDVSPDTIIIDAPPRQQAQQQGGGFWAWLGWR